MVDQSSLQNPELVKMMKNMQNQVQRDTGKHSNIESERKATKTPEDKVWAENRKRNKNKKKQKQKERRMRKK